MKEGRKEGRKKEGKRGLEDRNRQRQMGTETKRQRQGERRKMLHRFIYGPIWRQSLI